MVAKCVREKGHLPSASCDCWSICVGRPVAEACVQRVVFKALEKSKNGSCFLAEESEVVQRERAEGNGDGNEKRNAVAPPRQNQFIEAECAPPLPETF